MNLHIPTSNVPQQYLDWKAYFKAFCAKHGGNPLIYRGRLQFADGWAYSSTDYAGPEYPPPTDPVELNETLRYYWMRRKRIVTNELFELCQLIDNYTLLQMHKNAPLQQVFHLTDPETGKITVKRGALDMEALNGRKAWLEGDLVQCEQILQELSCQITAA